MHERDAWKSNSRVGHEIFSAGRTSLTYIQRHIFGDLFGGSGSHRGTHLSQGPYWRGIVLRAWKDATEGGILAVRKRSGVILKIMPEVQRHRRRQEPHCGDLCPKCGGKGQVVYTPSKSFFPDCGQNQLGPCPGLSPGTSSHSGKCRIAVERNMYPIRRRLQLRYRPA